MKLSIITINYNNIDGLQCTINSVLSQTWKDFEWIIIDGGSTDGSKELISDLTKSQNSNISYWCSEKDKGIYNAMNKGVAHANADYINFMNSGDTYYDDTSLSKMFENSFNAEITYGNAFWGLNKKYIFNSPQNLTLDYFIDGSLGHAACFIQRKLLVENPYDENYRIVSDWKNWLLWLIKGYKFEHRCVNVACFDTTGISTVNKELDHLERNKVWNELLSPAMNDVIRRCHKYEKSRFQNPELEEIEKLITKRLLYRKLFRLIKNILRRIG